MVGTYTKVEMKHYRRFRVLMEVAHLVLDIVLTAAAIYLVYLIYPMIPIFD